jgi:simple sugar transport system permease protein
MDINQVLSASFFIALVTAGIRLSIPVLVTVLGEIITESAGVMNLGLEGIMAVGGVVGFLTAFNLQGGSLHSSPQLAIYFALIAGFVAGMGMGLIMAFLSVTLRADQTVCGVTIVLLGVSLSNYLYRQAMNTLAESLVSLTIYKIPYLHKIPILGPILFEQNLVFYLVIVLVLVVHFFLFKTRRGLEIRSVGENPAAAATSGISVEKTRYLATIVGSGLTGLGGAILTVVQLGLFRENIIAGRGWVAVALVIFSRWRPKNAVIGALVFGLADSLQYRIQAVTQVTYGKNTVPYEFLLMLPYLLTIGVLLFRNSSSDAPATLGEPYVQDAR